METRATRFGLWTWTLRDIPLFPPPNSKGIG